MANARNPKRKGHDAGRDSGGFVAVPWAVLDCPAYRALSHPAKALLMEVARQYVRDNNGRLLASISYLRTRGWASKDVITRAVRELVAAGFVFQTVMGHRPNKASWYTVTWRALDKLPGYDVDLVNGFQRGAYQAGAALKPVKPAPPTPPHGAVKNATLSPPHGHIDPAIGPPHGQEVNPVGPPHGPIEATFGYSLSPPDGHHLENHLLQQERDASKADSAAPTAPPATDLQCEQAATLTPTVTADLVQVDDEQSDHADPPRTPPARRKRKAATSWIQCELMA